MIFHGNIGRCIHHPMEEEGIGAVITVELFFLTSTQSSEVTASYSHCGLTVDSLNGRDKKVQKEDWGRRLNDFVTAWLCPL